MNNNEVTSLGRHWGALLYVLNICRFSLFILLAGIVLLSVGQGQDLLLSVGEDHRYVLLLGSSLLWAFSLWLWTRTLLEIRFPDVCVDITLLAVYRRWLPRILGSLAFVGVAFAVQNAGNPASRLFWPTLLTGLVFIVIVSKRRPFARWVGSKLGQQQTWLQIDDIKGDAPLHADWREVLQTKLGKIAGFFLALGLVLFIWGLLSPITMGGMLNAQMILMLWASTFLPLGSIVTYYANKTGRPVTTLIVVLAVVFSLWNDNHAIRPMAGDSKPSDRMSIKDAIKAWKQVNCSTGECKPFVVVATAGGGIRAAYWTGTVLSYIHKQQSVFNDRLFAISAVSGGAVGSTVYRSVIAGADKGPCKGKVMDCTLQVLTKDYLSPLSASLLYPGLMQWFLPLPWLPDRALTLEESWERQFNKVTGQDTLTDSFSQLSRTGRPWPALFLNATWVNNGRRIVASSLDTSNVDSFSLSNDQLNIIGYDIRLSTAAHNSARAPYVSPAGSWREGKADDKTAGKIKGRLQDGGLFDTFGAETALEILKFAKTELKDQFKPLVIQISSTPSMPKDLAESIPGEASNLGYELITMFRTVFATTDGHAAELASKLKAWSEVNGSYAYFRMCDPQNGAAAPPFGWSLSDHAQTTIQSYLLKENIFTGESLPEPSCNKDNRAAVKRVLQVLQR